MVQAKGIIAFLRRRVGNFGILALLLAALEHLLDEEFVCPCQYAYNIAVCVLYGAVPSFGCFVLTYSFMERSPETDDGEIRDKCNKFLYSALTASIWLSLFLVDGRYLACALSAWEGVYAKNDTLGSVKWCKPTGNETSEFESQKMTLKWISRSQILGFFLILIVIIIVACVHKTQRSKTQRNTTEMETGEHSTMKLHGRLAERKFSFEVEEVTYF